MLDTNLPPAQLTFAAEKFGESCIDSDLAIKTLVPLLSHPNAVVREGVLYGLYKHFNDDVLKTVGYMSYHDDSPSVRQVASELLEYFSAPI